MTDWQTFKTRKEAKKACDSMFGWSANPVLIYDPLDENANREGMIWVVQCNNQGYLRKNGYIR